MNGNEGKDNVTEDIWVLETLFYALTNRNVWKSVGEGHVTVEHDNANHVNVGQYCISRTDLRAMVLRLLDRPQALASLVSHHHILNIINNNDLPQRKVKSTSQLSISFFYLWT